MIIKEMSKAFFQQSIVIIYQEREKLRGTILTSDRT